MIPWRWGYRGKALKVRDYFEVWDDYSKFFANQDLEEREIPTNLCLFTCLLYQQKTITQDRINKKGTNLVNKCIMFPKEEEDVNHLFWDCSFVNSGPFPFSKQAAIFLGLMKVLIASNLLKNYNLKY